MDSSIHAEDQESARIATRPFYQLDAVSLLRGVQWSCRFLQVSLESGNVQTEALEVVFGQMSNRILTSVFQGTRSSLKS